MEYKFNMTLEENIFLAKKNLISNIYSNAKVEGLAITFEKVKQILEGVNVSNLKIDDIECILNLRDAWKYLIDHISDNFDITFISKINEFVAKNESINLGVLRNRTSRNNRYRLYSTYSRRKRCNR